jgi:hypothetical protein
MNEEHDLAAWYESVERENVTEDLTVTHVHTTDGKVTLGRDWLAVNEGEAEWEPVIEVLHDSVAETFEPLTVPVDTAISALADAGLVRGGTDTARQRARGLLAYLHAEGALGLEEGAVVIDPPHDLVSSDCKFLFTYATWLDLLSMHLSERLEEYENEIADIEQGLTDEQEQHLNSSCGEIIDIIDIIDENYAMASNEIGWDEVDADEIAEYEPAEGIDGEEDTTGKISSVLNKNKSDNLRQRLLESLLLELEHVVEKIEQAATRIRVSAFSSIRVSAFSSRIQQVDIMDRYDDFEKTAESEIESSEDILERYSKGIQSEAEIPEPEEFRLSSAPPANADTDETED